MSRLVPGVLDLGCGSGWTSLFLARAGYEVWGVDISEHMVEIARQAQRTGTAGHEFVVADMEDLNLAQHDFDAVLLFDALHHCAGYARVLVRACQHLKTGGHLLLKEPSWLHRYSPHARATARKYGVTELGFSRFHLRRSLCQAGFRSCLSYYDGCPAYRGFSGFPSCQPAALVQLLVCLPIGQADHPRTQVSICPNR